MAKKVGGLDDNRARKQRIWPHKADFKQVITEIKADVEADRAAKKGKGGKR